MGSKVSLSVKLGDSPLLANTVISPEGVNMVAMQPCFSIGTVLREIPGILTSIENQKATSLFLGFILK